MKLCNTHINTSSLFFFLLLFTVLNSLKVTAQPTKATSFEYTEEQQNSLSTHLRELSKNYELIQYFLVRHGQKPLSALFEKFQPSNESPSTNNNSSYHWQPIQQLKNRLPLKGTEFNKHWKQATSPLKLKNETNDPVNFLMIHIVNNHFREAMTNGKSMFWFMTRLLGNAYEQAKNNRQTNQVYLIAIWLLTSCHEHSFVAFKETFHQFMNKHKEEVEAILSAHTSHTNCKCDTNPQPRSWSESWHGTKSTILHMATWPLVAVTFPLVAVKSALGQNASSTSTTPFTPGPSRILDADDPSQTTMESLALDDDPIQTTMDGFESPSTETNSSVITQYLNAVIDYFWTLSAEDKK